ncbi:MAG: hypothetical protein KJZ47_14480, partial [Gemmatimonadales bacterium]|nr:hypothetical protein [Gemmatimonadales bacterium]
MLPRLTPSAATLLLLLAAACIPTGEAPSLTDEALGLAAVFETAEPYSRRSVDPAEIAGFFEQYPEYRQDSALVLAFYQRRDWQYAWFVENTLSASAEAFVTLAGLTD